MILLDIEKKLFGADGPIHLRVKTSLEQGELTVLYGPSGAGKTSILRMISGLMQPDKGIIMVGGETWFDSNQKINLKTQKRNIGMVFQDYSLFPNMTVRGNLEYALQKNQSTAIVDELFEIIGLSNLQDKKPVFLSGGQKQRVALARSMIRQPKLLLLDEPLSALDTVMRNRLQDQIQEFHKKFNLTSLLVSHDYQEVKKLAARVLVIENGQVVKDGPPNAVLSF